MRKAYKRHIKTHTQNKTKAKREISDTTYKECTNYKRAICQTVRYLSMKRFHHDLITLAGTLQLLPQLALIHEIVKQGNKLPMHKFPEQRIYRWFR